MSKALSTFLIILLFAGCFSCYNTNNDYGSGLVNTAFRNISIDTSTIVVSSTLIDSLETTGQEKALAGQYKHPLWGTVIASAYFPYLAPSYSTDADETVFLDSLVLSLPYGAYFLGDTAQQQRFTVHRLKEKIILNDNGYLYNNSSFAYESEPMGEFTFKPHPNGGEPLSIRLSDDFGKDLLLRLHSRDQSVSSERFEDYFKGLVVVPDRSVSHSVLSFLVNDTSSTLVLHYHVAGELTEETECVIKPNTEKQFYNISHDRKGTALENLPLKNVEVPSGKIGNRGFLFGGIGWYTRLKFPYLNNLQQQGKQVIIESASLKIYPEPGTYSTYDNLPDSLYLYITDENNVVTDAVKDYLGEEVQAGTLVRDDTYDEKTYYYFDVSTFMKEELGAFDMYKHNLQLVFREEDYTGSFKNLTFSDQQGRSPIVLQLIYKVYESY